jgi:uncharacterized pyridoxamine 5'-phosphate oxidase family protein
MARKSPAEASFGDLTSGPDPSQNTANFHKFGQTLLETEKQFAMHMTPMPPSQPAKKITRELCKHPQVEIVSRDEDSEYVECKECGDVFESSEFKDMAIEERKDLGAC